MLACLSACCARSQAGLVTCLILETTGILGYGVAMPAHVRQVLTEFTKAESEKLHNGESAELAVQAISLVLLVVGFAFNVRVCNA